MTSWNGLRRSPLKRRSPIKPSTFRRTRRSIRKLSRKRAVLAVERRQFVRMFLMLHPLCEIAWHPDCTGLSAEVHESLRRGRGGASVPGELATRQGQRFWAVCRLDHEAVTNPPSAAFQALAIEEGWVMNYPVE